MNFQDAVKNVPEIAACLKNGIQALNKKDREKIEVSETRSLTGSVDIDTCLKNDYPNKPRWDYVLGYKDKVYYVEFHQGKTSEVANVIAKLNWLKHWRKHSATSLETLKDRSSYHWISTKGTTPIRKGSRYRRILDQNDINGPCSMLDADSVS